MNKDFSNFILISDVDGTLLLTSEHYINPRNFEMSQKFMEMGGYFTLASGRNVESLKPYAEKFMINAPAITSNGACIYDYQKNEYLSRHFVPKSSSLVINDVLENCKDIAVEITTPESIYIIRVNEYNAHHVDRKNYRMCKNIDDIKEQWTKVIFCHNDIRLKEIEKYLESKYTDVNLIRSGDTYYEIIPNGVNKSIGVKFIQKILNIDNSNIFAIGDYYNDKEMLKYANISATTAIASDDIKEVADLVMCKCEEGAVADFIEYLINNYGDKK